MDEDNQQPLDQSVDESQASPRPDPVTPSPIDDDLGLGSENNTDISDDQFSAGQVRDEPASSEVPAASELPSDPIPDISAEPVDSTSDQTSPELASAPETSDSEPTNDGQSQPQVPLADASSEQPSLPDADVNSTEPTAPSEPSLSARAPTLAPQQSVINDVTPAPSGPLASPDSPTPPPDSSQPIASTEPEKKGFWSKLFGKK